MGFRADDPTACPGSTIAPISVRLGWADCPYCQKNLFVGRTTGRFMPHKGRDIRNPLIEAGMVEVLR